ncbi:hypothetical protein BLNAU_21586 [Blattamonas nauphoetae]|uniref:Uncharacterized protein n=1 Tax=Blattamonas nauphoetae TaxID=2049346 RepID=A0ABQ9WVJ1_9EUKA|nr:hypothetical protein BLNAU_21586 [Blattamonas nauphoetae]
MNQRKNFLISLIFSITHPDLFRRNIKNRPVVADLLRVMFNALIHTFCERIERPPPKFSELLLEKATTKVEEEIPAEGGDLREGATVE